MFLSNPAKALLAVMLISFASAGCGLFGAGGDTVARTPEQPKSSIPFATTEPENFQCEIVETAGDIVRRKRLARKGSWRRVDLDLGEKRQRAVLQTDRTYLLDIGRGVYAEIAAPGPEGSPSFSDLTHELLAVDHNAHFEETSREGSIVRYTVRPADGAASEILVTYDGSIGLPVKQEFFSLNGETRTLQFTVEMVNFKADPDADIFAIPPDFKRVSVNELVSTQEK